MQYTEDYNIVKNCPQGALLLYFNQRGTVLHYKVKTAMHICFLKPMMPVGNSDLTIDCQVSSEPNTNVLCLLTANLTVAQFGVI